MRSKYEPAVYAALKTSGMSNREIARQLGVNEASVRRGLRSARFTDEHPFGRSEPVERRFMVTVTEVD